MAVSKSWLVAGRWLYRVVAVLYMEVGSQLMAVYTCEHHADSYIKRSTELGCIEKLTED
jgi:hypothetical protein